MDGNSPFLALQGSPDSTIFVRYGPGQPVTNVRRHHQEIWRQVALPLQGTFNQQGTQYPGASKQETGREVAQQRPKELPGSVIVFCSGSAGLTVKQMTTTNLR